MKYQRALQCHGPPNCDQLRITGQEKGRIPHLQSCYSVSVELFKFGILHVPSILSMANPVNGESNMNRLRDCQGIRFEEDLQIRKQ